MRRKIAAIVGWGALAVIFLAVRAYDRITGRAKPEWLACLDCGVVLSECQCREQKT